MYYEKIELTRYIGAELHEREVNGKLETCISIPIVPNGLVFGKKCEVYMRLICNDRKPNYQNVSHYVSVYVPDKKFWENLDKLGYRNNLMYLGEMKPSFFQRKKLNKNPVSLDEAMDRDR